jgi:hypothetical protein
MRGTVPNRRAELWLAGPACPGIKTHKGRKKFGRGGFDIGQSGEECYILEEGGGLLLCIVRRPVV